MAPLVIDQLPLLLDAQQQKSPILVEGGSTFLETCFLSRENLELRYILSAPGNPPPSLIRSSNADSKS